MFNCTHDIDEGTCSNGSTSQCATELDPASVFAEDNVFKTEADVDTSAHETQCEGGVCSLNWTPGTRH